MFSIVSLDVLQSSAVLLR